MTTDSNKQILGNLGQPETSTAESKRFAPHLDEMLLLTEAAKWLRIKKRQLAAKSRGRRPVIPGFWLNQRVVRYHPRTIIAKLAKDANVSPDVIRDSLALPGNRGPK